MWGYDRTFLDACREELSLKAEDLEKMTVVVAEDDGVVAGLYQLDIRGDDAELLKLFIEPDQLRSGWGRKLFEAALGEAKRRGAIRLHIEADPDAVPFYERMGAVRIGVAPSGSIPGRILPKLEYRL